ncbi:MAG: DNA polymerase III subunit gamma/tau [Mucinivorans sp.]
MENFVVSARKYRPATFRSVVGQGHITQTLQSAIERGTLAHAYLFTGPRGVGKTTCARIFAKAINCLNPTPDHEACGVCESCVAFDQGRSWGIHELDAASNNSVEDIRLLTEKVRVAPQVGRYSVYIIDEVHMLSTSAFNAFLKTLEEPPSYAIFILATTEKHKILPTILSRCQSYDFRRIRLEDIVSYLAYVAQSEGIKYDEESLNIIAQKADGGMRDALSTFDRVVSFSGGSEITFAQTAQSVGALDFNTYFRAVDLAWAEDYGPLLLLYDSVLESGFEGQIFIAGLADHFRNLLVARSEDTLSLLEATGSLLERYRNQASRLDVPFIMNAISLLSSCDGGYRNATNRRLHSELALMKLSGLKKKEFNIEQPSFPLPIIMAATTAPQAVAIEAQAEVSATETKVVEVARPIEPNTPRPTTRASLDNRPSASGFSINGLVGFQSVSSENKPRREALQLTETQSEALLRENWQAIIETLHTMNRPRLANSMSSSRIVGHNILTVVPTEDLSNEIMQSKIEIETHIMELCGVKANIEVEIREVVQAYRPVTMEQKMQYLVDINPNILKLQKSLELTI